MTLPSPSAPALAAASIPVVVAHGDGIGPEIMEAVLFILGEAGAGLELYPIEVGEQVYRRGVPSGIAPEAWDLIRAHRVMLKAPITTPQGGGYKSLNVTLRKTLGLYANVRPCQTFHPFVPTRHPGMDVVIVRENEEDTYAGIEHQQTPEVVQCLKLVSRPGCERVVRYAFEYARAHGRKKVHCFTKDNIMKITDGLFHRVFDEIAPDYPEIEAHHLIIDIGTALLADRPTDFDVIVTPNLYGDIISDVAAQVAGSVGMAGSANIGEQCAMFEAIHGTAPDIAGRDLANPSALLMGAVQMLVYLGRSETAQAVHNAWLTTLEDGVHTGDVYRDGVSRQRVGTRDFARAVVERLGRSPTQLPVVAYRGGASIQAQGRSPNRPRPAKEMVGVDVFVDWDEPGRNADVLAARLKAAAVPALDLSLITNRGVKVYPNGLPETQRTDHWRCRFKHPAGASVTHADVLALLGQLHEAGIDFIKTEHLYTFDGERGYSLGQGE